ncbi:helix-turn-helix domain-containing protein [Streptomyces sp. NPDC017529]|uniref:helix-turn-helix domain-containing protein n=1 Tax=Streptomyces sp. NPDC017529 TaxID=3365000 RepID=UPI0037B31EE7
MSTASGTDDFAALLRTLKTRSGLSYGALAKRLHMSTSTLHRYCNGDAVPTDYAPVERLARVCGAKPEELVELHRQWILADAARGRRAVEEDAPVLVPVPAPAPEPAPEPESTAPEPTVPEPAPTPTRRPSRTKLRWALVGTAALALAVPVVVSGMTSSGEAGPGAARVKVPDHRPDSGGRGAVPDGGTSVTPSPSASVSASVSAGPTGQPKQDSAPASADPGSAATGGGTGGSARRGGTPLTVDVRTNNWDDPCDRWYMLGKPPTEVPPPPSGVSARGWANALGGVPGGHLRVSLAVQGTGDEAVVLHSLNVRTTARTAAVAGSAYSMGDGCGGGLTPASFDVGLDAAQPLTRPIAGEQGDRKIPATDFPFKVSASDPQALYVDAHTEANDVSWYLELEWSSGGRRGTLRLDDHGRPFRTSAMKGRPAYGYRYDKNVWEPIENPQR